MEGDDKVSNLRKLEAGGTQPPSPLQYKLTKKKKKGRIQKCHESALQKQRWSYIFVNFWQNQIVCPCPSWPARREPLLPGLLVPASKI